MKHDSKINTLENLEKHIYVLKNLKLSKNLDTVSGDIEDEINEAITKFVQLENQLLIQTRLISTLRGLFLPSLKISLKSKNLSNKPQLQKLCLFADNLPISWGKIVKTSAADYEDRINELWGAGKYLSAKWNQKLAWLCALSNLGYYLWLKAWKPVSTVFRRLL